MSGHYQELQEQHFYLRDHNQSTLQVQPVIKNMRIALVLNLTFSCIEFAGGILTNSVAVLSDAIHDLGDSIAIAASLVLEKRAGEGRSQTFTYGKRRFSTLSAFITSLILIIGSVVIITEAVPRFFQTAEIKVGGMLWLAVLGVLFNGLALLRLRTGSETSLNQRAVMLHMMEDALGWVAVLVGAIIMYYTHWYWIDPLLSVGIALFIFYNASRNIISVLKIFLQAVPDVFNEQELKMELEQLPGVRNAHSLHCWTMDGENNVLTVHLTVPTDYDIQQSSDLISRARQVIAAQNIQHTTIQIEAEGHHCRLNEQASVVTFSSTKKDNVDAALYY